MTDELDLHGKIYVSSKRAAQETGYTRDYIGQLSRAGLIEAERVGGLWYVSLSSLREYEDHTDSIRSNSVEVLLPPRSAESLLNFDGREYFSASRASKVSGYNQDYVGQLARSGKIPSRQVGNRWYVDIAALRSHKEEKDALLASVQKESVGLTVNNSATEIALYEGKETNNHLQSTGVILYQRDDRDLIPRAGRSDRAAPTRVSDPRAPVHLPLRTNFSQPAPLRPSYSQNRAESTLVLNKRTRIAPRQRKSHRSLFKGLAGVLTIILVVSVGMTAQKVGVSFTSVPVARMTASASGGIGRLMDVVEEIVSPSLVYERNL